MKPGETQIDPILLQRLIDGELDNEQVQQILAKANSAPDQWQEIAVGFVESQTWANAFQSDLAKYENSRLNQGSVLVQAPIGKIKNDNQTFVQPAQDQNAVENTRAQTIPYRRSPNPWWVMAASLLVAGAIGFMTSEILNRDIPRNSIAENPEPLVIDSPDLEIANNGSSADELPKMTPAKLTPDYHVEVPHDNEKSNSQIPIYRVTSEQQLNQLYTVRQQESAVPPQILRQFSGAGYQIQTDIEFISGKIGNDESFVIPVRTIYFVPGQ